MNKILLFIVLLCQNLPAQIIKGSIPQAKNSEIILKGYDGLIDKELTKTIADSLGNFSIIYPKEYNGAAVIQIDKLSNVIVLLNHEDFQFEWKNVQDFTTLKFYNSPENEFFIKGVIVNKEAETKLSALKFLLPQYNATSKERQWLAEEIAIQEQQLDIYLNQLSNNSYVKTYLKARKLIANFMSTDNRSKEQMIKYESLFNNLHFNDQKLYSSGLLKDIFESYFVLMESYVESDEMYNHINVSNEAWIKSLEPNPTLQQEVAQHLFTFFEKRSLYKAAENLALKMLNQSNCQLSDKSINLFEQYRKLAVGNTAPNIIFKNKVNNKNSDLKKLPNRFKLVVFGASWCPNCQTDYPTLLEKFKVLKEKHDLEIIYISIDTDKKAFEDYFKNAPFTVFCDAKGWETEAAKDYHVFATPTYILLDNKLKILSKIYSPEHLEAWLQLHGNK